MPSDQTLLQGRMLDRRYLVGEQIARGGMASVYSATDTRLDRVVAIKVMHPGLGDGEEFTERFVREAQSAAKLNHPNVVAVFDQGDDDGTVYLVMELVEGRTLRDLMRDESPMVPRRALALFEQVLLALSAAHAAHIVHRDIKPENVLLAPDGRVKVADFGLARAVSSVTAGGANTSSGALIGTVSYLAPELVLNHGSDARSDVYACGAVLYEMLTGVKPHWGESPIQIAYRHVHEDVPAPSQHIEGIPPYLDALIARATAREPDLRSADARVLLRQLRQVRHALDRGLGDDPELTADLTPRSLPQQSAGPPQEQAPQPTPPASADRPDPTLVVGPRNTDGRDSWDAVMPPTVIDGRPEQVPQQSPAAQRPPATQQPLPSPPKTTSTAASSPPPAPATGSASAEDPPVLPQPARKSRRGLIWFVVIMILALLAAAGGFYFGVVRYSTTPELTGETTNAARDLAQDRGLSIDVAGEEYSESVPKGAVIETEPEAGDNILDGGTVDVVVSMGKERYEVPDLAGMSQDDARAKLEKRHLAVGEIHHRYSGKVETGIVVRGSTKSGKLVRRDTEIDLYVSKGRRPIDVVSQVGERARDARAALEDAGFDVDITRTHDPDAPRGEVISQSPNSGSAYRNDTITLVVSRGPARVTVPDVTLAPVEEATEELEKAGLEVKVVQDDLNIGADLVRSQDPAGGDRVARGSTVTLTVI